MGDLKKEEGGERMCVYVEGMGGGGGGGGGGCPLVHGISPASFSSGRANSLMGGLGGGRYICRTLVLSGENDKLGGEGASTISAISGGGI